MLHEKRIIVVMPAYNASRTLEMTYHEIPKDIVDEVILVDDQSRDDTATQAEALGIRTIVHLRNRGYGGNQKTCYNEALSRGADVVVMVHPDYQYSPRLVTAMSSMITSGHYDIVLGSRILGGGALKGGMPLYKYIANRGLTFLENLALGAKLSEYHTGLRAFSRTLLESLPLEANNDDFVFDNEVLAQAVYFGFRIGEISCPTRYFDDASSTSFKQSVKYGLGVLGVSAKYVLARGGIIKPSIFTVKKD
ncbi:MAG: Undecaprenyl-phosphate mannosyltransferase [Syntrophorhabdus sp. PtaB.Bin006]|nr:MAG: Undecaprenyl-phosphate mannosyltransferase [Syntrophorhabdus sp. PtaB.Bin006]